MNNRHKLKERSDQLFQQLTCLMEAHQFCAVHVLLKQGDIQQSEAAPTVQKALWCAAILHYARLFTSGSCCGGQLLQAIRQRGTESLHTAILEDRNCYFAHHDINNNNESTLYGSNRITVIRVEGPGKYTMSDMLEHCNFLRSELNSIINSNSQRLNNEIQNI